MTFTIPAPLKLEHEELHADLVKATQAGGRVGDAANAVASVLHDHFVKEEQFALPPLGLLSRLARGQVDENIKTVLALTDRLKVELLEMLEEHKAVVAALKTLITATEADNKPEHAVCRRVMLHAQTEEEVLYPAAILIGEYVNSGLKRLLHAVDPTLRAYRLLGNPSALLADQEGTIDRSQS